MNDVIYTNTGHTDTAFFPFFIYYTTYMFVAVCMICQCYNVVIVETAQFLFFFCSFIYLRTIKIYRKWFCYATKRKTIFVDIFPLGFGRAVMFNLYAEYIFEMNEKQKLVLMINCNCLNVRVWLCDTHTVCVNIGKFSMGISRN